MGGQSCGNAEIRLADLQDEPAFTVDTRVGVEDEHVVAHRLQERLPIELAGQDQVDVEELHGRSGSW